MLHEEKFRFYTWSKGNVDSRKTVPIVDLRKRERERERKEREQVATFRASPEIVSCGEPQLVTGNIASEQKSRETIAGINETPGKRKAIVD